MELAALRDAALIPQLVAKTLGIPLSPEQPAYESLLAYMQSKVLLLVLDNCEHMIAGCAQLAQKILALAPDLRILATSREPLAIAGEAMYPLTGLTWPTADHGSADATQLLMQFDAVRLFVERVQVVLPNFIITPENAFALVHICRRVDGLPLALELASAHANVLTLKQIAERLDGHFDLLVSRQRSEPDARHHNLRATMDWSYNLLAPPEKVLLRRLSVFVAGCSLSTAEAVCAGDGIEREQVYHLLSSLVNKSLIVAQTLQASEARFSMLETVRQYAQEQLAASGESSLVQDRQLDCFVQLAEEAAQKLTGTYQRLWLNWLESEYDNIRAALAWSLESGRIEAGLRIAIAVYQFWTIRDYVQEGLGWLERLLARANEEISPLVVANALAYAAFLAGFRGNTAAQLAYGREAAALAEKAGDVGKPALKWALSAQSYGARAAGDHQTEFDLGQRVIQLNRESGDRYQLGLTLSLYSFTAMLLGKYDVAHAYLDEALPLLREAGNTYRIAMALNFSGDLARLEQEYLQALAAYEESSALLRELGAVRDLASSLSNLGHTCLHLGDVERAHAHFNESLSIQQDQKNTPGMAECLIGFAAVALVSELPVAGARLLAAAVSLGGQRVVSAWAATRMEYDRCLAAARSDLSEAEFQAEQVVGRAYSLEQALNFALSLPVKPETPFVERDQTRDLTSREQEIAALIALGKSNGEIANELVLSKRTVEKHIANILSKLMFTNRAQIVRWAIEFRLIKIAE